MAPVVKIVARAKTLSENLNTEDTEKRIGGHRDFSAMRLLVRDANILVMTFYSAGYCADGWSGFGDRVGPGSFCGGAQDECGAATRE